MATFAEDLRTLLASTTGSVNPLVATRIHYNHVPQFSDKPHIWFRTSSDVEARTLDASGGVHEAFIDLECIGAQDSLAQPVADAVKNTLDGFKGSVNNHQAQGIFVTDKDDSYEPQSIDSDEGRSIAALELHVFYTT